MNASISNCMPSCSHINLDGNMTSVVFTACSQTSVGVNTFQSHWSHLKATFAFVWVAEVRWQNIGQSAQSISFNLPCVCCVEDKQMDTWWVLLWTSHMTLMIKGPACRVYWHLAGRLCMATEYRLPHPPFPNMLKKWRSYLRPVLSVVVSYYRNKAVDGLHGRGLAPFVDINGSFQGTENTVILSFRWLYMIEKILIILQWFIPDIVCQ